MPWAVVMKPMNEKMTIPQSTLVNMSLKKTGRRVGG
jgi:hypothetical protein